MDASAPPSVAIVGLGFGRAHVAAFQAVGARVVALCQRDVTAARALAEAGGVAQAFGRWEEMLERARPDIVVIATPPHLHCEIALAALAGGAHVLCEKPIATSVAEARTMVDAAARAGRVAMTGFNWRFTAGMQRLRALVADGAVGRILHVSARWLGARWADETAPATWRMDRAQAGHGGMGDMGVHLVDLVRWTCGDFRRVVAHTGIAYPGRGAPGTGREADAEDYAAVLGELVSGAQVTLTVSRVAHGRYEHGLEIHGTRGAVAYRLLRNGAPGWYTGELQAASAGRRLAPVALDVPAVEDGDELEVLGRATIAPLARRLLEAIEDGAAASPSLDDGLRAQAVLEAVQQSARGGGWVAVTGA